MGRVPPPTRTPTRTTAQREQYPLLAGALAPAVRPWVVPDPGAPLRKCGTDHNPSLFNEITSAATPAELCGTAEVNGLAKLPACSACQGRRFWRSVHGPVICGQCHPPGSPSLVADWVESVPKETGGG